MPNFQRISCPRRQGLADRCIEHLLGGSGRLCFLSSGHPAPVSSENDHLQVQGHCDSTRVAGDALVLGSGGIVSQDSTAASSSAQSTEATFQSQIPQGPASLLQSISRPVKHSLSDRPLLSLAPALLLFRLGSRSTSATGTNIPGNHERYPLLYGLVPCPGH